MPKHAETRFLPYRDEQVFSLVADVARYPEFLPWCSAARVRSIIPAENCEIMEADLVISFKVFRERFGSRVRLCRQTGRIETTYLDGPFRYLQSNWTIEQVQGGCDVAFDVDFEFRNIVLQKAIGLVFGEAMQRIVHAFEDRAETLYG